MTELTTMSVHALSERVAELEQQLAAANWELERVRDVGRWPLEYGAQVYANTALVGCEPIDCLHDAVNQMLKALASPAAEPTPCGHVWVPYSEEARHVEFEMCAKCPEIRRAQPAPVTEPKPADWLVKKFDDFSNGWDAAMKMRKQPAPVAQPEQSVAGDLSVERTATGLLVKPDHSSQRIAKLYEGLEQIKPKAQSQEGEQ